MPTWSRTLVKQTIGIGMCGLSDGQETYHECGPSLLVISQASRIFLWGERKKKRLGQYARFPCTLLECGLSQSDGSCHMIVDSRHIHDRTRGTGGITFETPEAWQAHKRVVHWESHRPLRLQLSTKVGATHCEAGLARLHR